MDSAPLTDKHLESINKALHDLTEAERQAHMAVRAGFDQTENLKDIAATKGRLNLIKQVYFPGR
jgi:hypothetical protein